MGNRPITLLLTSVAFGCFVVALVVTSLDNPPLVPKVNGEKRFDRPPAGLSKPTRVPQDAARDDEALESLDTVGSRSPTTVRRAQVRDDSDPSPDLEELVRQYRELPETYESADRRFSLLGTIATLDLDPQQLQRVLFALVADIDPTSSLRTDTCAAAGSALSTLWKANPEMLADVRDRVHWEDNPVVLHSLVSGCASHRDSDELVGFDEDLLWLQDTTSDTQLRTMIAANIGFFSSRWGVGADAMVSNLRASDLRIPAIHGARGMLENYEKFPGLRRITREQRDALVDGLVEAARDPSLRREDFRSLIDSLGRVSNESLWSIDRSVFERHGVELPDNR